jgi:hypothetical protein
MIVHVCIKIIHLNKFALDDDVIASQKHTCLSGVAGKRDAI